MPPPSVIISLPFVLVALFLGLTWVMERRRTQALEQAAAELGMTFEPKPASSPGSGFELMQRGRSRRVRNLVRGAIEDVRAELFDYLYVTGSGKNSTTHRQSVVLLHMQGAGVPRFILSPEGLWSKIGTLLGFDDIDFGEDPEFSRRFHLKSEHEHAIRTLFDAELRATVLDTTEKLCVEAHGSDVIVYRRSRMKPEEIMSRLTEAFELASHVWDRAAQTAGATSYGAEPPGAHAA